MFTLPFNTQIHISQNPLHNNFSIIYFCFYEIKISFFLFSCSQLDLSDLNADYVDVVRPGEDLRRILNYVKERNKKW